jgi:hypothetical protein
MPTSTLHLRLTATLDVHTIEDNLHAFRLDIEPARSRMEGDFAFPPQYLPLPTRTQGYVDNAGLEKLHHLGPGDALPTLPLSFLSMEDQERLRTEGFASVFDQSYPLPGENAFDLFSSNAPAIADELVRMDGAKHRVWTRHDRLLPSLVKIDYTWSALGEKTHDLEAVASHLLTRPDIRLLHAADRSSPKAWQGQGRPVTRGIEAVMTIPHYNQDEDRRKSVEFAWVPSDEDFARWQQSMMDNSIDSLGRIHHLFEMDMFGVAAFTRKARPPRP